MINSLRLLHYAGKQRHVARKCARRCHAYVIELIQRHADSGADMSQDPPPEFKQKVEFWLRAMVRYHRISNGRSPWRISPEEASVRVYSNGV